MRFTRIAVLLCAQLLTIANWVGVAGAQEIFVTNQLGGGVGEVSAYTASGALVSASYVSVPAFAGPDGLAASATNLYVAYGNVSQIGAYTLAGATVNQSFTGGAQVNDPWGMAVAGGNLYVANGSPLVVSEFNASTGAVENESLVTYPTVGDNFGSPIDVAVSGNDLYVVWSVDGNSSYTIGEYNATTGAAINASLVTGLPSANDYYIAVSGNDLFASDTSTGDVSEYNATTGALINSARVTGINHPEGMAVFDGDLFVTSFGSYTQAGTGTVGEYTLTGGAVNASLITGLTGSFAIAVVPEPSTWLMLAIGAAALLAFRRKRRCAN